MGLVVHESGSFQHILRYVHPPLEDFQFETNEWIWANEIEKQTHVWAIEKKGVVKCSEIESFIEKLWKNEISCIDEISDGFSRRRYSPEARESTITTITYHTHPHAITYAPACIMFTPTTTTNANILTFHLPYCHFLLQFVKHQRRW